MFRLFKKLFRLRRSRRLRDRAGSPGEDQLNSQDVHQNSPASSEHHAAANAEDSNLSYQNHQDLALKLQPSFPQTCSWLEPQDLQDIGERPVDGGRFADVWKGNLDGREVAIKAYRTYIRFDCDRVRMRFYNEAHRYNLLSHRNIVPFVGVYSTPKHPFSLVFELMEHLNLTEYLRNKPDARKLELITGIARGLHHMHDLGVVHGNLEITNVLVDSEDTPRIAGLGSASVESSPPAWSEDLHELTRCSAPELANPEAFELPKAQTTKASDVYALGVLVYQVFAGRRMFPNLSDTAAIFSMLDGSRPPRPDDPEFSDRVWDMINGCWERMPSQRITIADVVSVLETELRQTR